MRVRDGMKLAIGFIMVNAIIGGVAAVVSELVIRTIESLDILSDEDVILIRTADTNGETE